MIAANDGRIRPPFPMVIDSSLLSTWRDCRMKAKMMYFDHWKPGAESIHLVAGKAFASGLEATRRAFFIDQLPAEDAIALGLNALWREYGEFQPAEDDLKGPIRMAGALEYYFSRYPLGADGTVPHIFAGEKPGIEFSFIEPLPNVRHPETGDPILVSGRADMAADAYGGLFLVDEKTTSRLGPTWSKQWDLRSQFTAYCWGLRAHGFRPLGCIVRGVAIYKSDYDTQQAITYRSDWEIDRWVHTTEREVLNMIEAWVTGEWDYNLDHACAQFGGCPFQIVCKSPEPDRWLETRFHRRKWDPVTRTETVLEN